MTTVEVIEHNGHLDTSKLTFDSDVQCRESISMELVAEYKASLMAGAKFPPIVVFHDGKVHWVADGFHRGQAYKEANRPCPCDVRQGTKRDAILYAVGANTGHGLRRSPADKRRAVETLLRDSVWCKWSNREVAKQVGVSHTFVDGLRPVASPVGNVANSTDEPEPTTRKGSDGKNYPVKPRVEKPVEKVEVVREPELVEEVDEGEDLEETLECIRELEKKDPEAYEKFRTGEIDGQVAYDAMKAKEKPTKAKRQPKPRDFEAEYEAAMDAMYTLAGSVKRKHESKQPITEAEAYRLALAFFAWMKVTDDEMDAEAAQSKRPS